MSKVNILCPYCFEPFVREAVRVQCVNIAEVQKVSEDGTIKKSPVCPSEEDEKYNNHWGSRVKIKYVYPANLTRKERGGLFSKPKEIQAKPCPRCGILSQRFVCPHCHNWLPTEMIEKGSDIISVVGGPASGKSNYIVALIHQLRKYQARLGLSVTLQQVGRNESEMTTNLFKEAEKTIFKQKEALRKTQVTKNPIPWIIRLESRITGKAVYLVFYDTAGEVFKNIEKMRDALYYQHSKAVIVAFDTLAIPKIKKVLEKKNIDINDEAYDYKEMWDTIQNFSQQHRDYKLTSRPYAFVFTKFDTVIDNYEDLDFRIEGSSFIDDEGDFKNSSYIKDGVVKMDELKDCSSIIADALRDPEIWDEESFVTNIEKEWGDNGMFFGVSALGGMTDGVGNIQTKKNEDGEEVVKPIRVLDPLIWILWKLGGFGINIK